jgi:hypothetical protein
MTPHKIAQEALGEQLQNKYVIQSSGPKVTSWVKDVIFIVDGITRYEGRLRWNENDGYEMFWDDKVPLEADRPEFNYILDSLTRQDYK